MESSFNCRFMLERFQKESRGRRLFRLDFGLVLRTSSPRSCDRSGRGIGSSERKTSLDELSECRATWGQKIEEQGEGHKHGSHDGELVQLPLHAGALPESIPRTVSFSTGFKARGEDILALGLAIEVAAAAAKERLRLTSSQNAMPLRARS